MWVDRQATVQETIQPKILLVVAMGGALFIVGMVLLVFAEHVAAYMRFLLPFPPISVAAYIYVLNRMSETDALAGPSTLQADVRHLLLQT